MLLNYEFDPEKRRGQDLRYKQWLEMVELWAKQYGITVDQAIAILFEDASCSKNKKITANELLSWAECGEFYFKFKDKYKPL